MEKENFWPAEEGNLEGNGVTYLEKGNIWSVEVKKNAEGKGEKYLEKENIWSKEKMKKKRDGNGETLHRHAQTDGNMKIEL